MLEDILDFFGRKKSKSHAHSREVDRSVRDDDRVRRRHDDDDDDYDRRDSAGKPSKKRRFSDLLEMD